MKRRVFLCVSLAVGVTALSPARISLAAGQPPAPGTITTGAGTGQQGFSGDNGPATKARLDWPQGIAIGAAVDTVGNLFIADFENYRVRKVDAKGMISTVAGTGMALYAGDGVLAMATGLRGPYGVAVDAAGNLLFCDTGEDDHVGETDADRRRLDYNERVLKVVGVAAPGLLAGMPFPKPQ